MGEGLSLAQECAVVGRMLQVQPVDAVLEAFLDVFPSFAPVCREDVEQDYLRLFVGLGTPLAPPWESAWASDARLLFQRETLDVRYWYRSAGLQAAKLHHEPDDHLGLELEFIGRLLDRGETDMARAFAHEHPLAWADRWVVAVDANALHPFYPALAHRALDLLTCVEGT